MGDQPSRAWADTASAMLAHSLGDHPRVIAATDRLAALGGMIGSSDPVIFRWQELRIEALVRLGRLDEAAELSASYTRRCEASGSRSVQANAARVRGLLAAALGRPAQACWSSRRRWPTRPRWTSRSSAP